MTPASSTTIHAPALIAAARVSPSGPCTNHSSAGMSHTQWWLQEMGEKSRPKNCTMISVPSRSSWSSPRHASTQSSAAHTTATSQMGPVPTSWPAKRLSAPRIDWLMAEPTGPMREASPANVPK